MRTVAVIAGHVGIENLRLDGLCVDKDPVKLRGGTGTRGERVWTGDIAQRLARALQGLGIDAFAADASGGDDIRGRFDLLIALHYQRDRITDRAFCGIPAAGAFITDEARAAAADWQRRFNDRYSALSGIPVTAERGEGANLTGYYLWCYIDAGTPAVLVECGNADVDAATLYESEAPGHVTTALAQITAEWALMASPVPEPPPASASVPVIGSSALALARIARGIWRFNSRAPFEILRLYDELAPLAGIRADVALAQAAHETGWFTFPRIARPEWNNYAGLGCSETTRQCEIFPTPELGVRAHLGHLLAYFGDHVPAFCDIDPRHDLVGHRHLANDIGALGGGQWAPSPTYGAAVASLLDKISAP
jgi:hypothetical protein